MFGGPGLDRDDDIRLNASVTDAGGIVGGKGCDLMRSSMVWNLYLINSRCGAYEANASSFQGGLRGLGQSKHLCGF